MVVAFLRLLEVDGVPNSFEVLDQARLRLDRERQTAETHIGLDVEVLKVEGVLPCVDTDGGVQMQEGSWLGAPNAPHSDSIPENKNKKGTSVLPCIDLSSDAK